jgi:hypothetical protein
MPLQVQIASTPPGVTRVTSNENRTLYRAKFDAVTPKLATVSPSRRPAAASTCGRRSTATMRALRAPDSHANVTVPARQFLARDAGRGNPGAASPAHRPGGRIRRMRDVAARRIAVILSERHSEVTPCSPLPPSLTTHSNNAHLELSPPPNAPRACARPSTSAIDLLDSGQAARRRETRRGLARQ